MVMYRNCVGAYFVLCAYNIMVDNWGKTKVKHPIIERGGELFKVCSRCNLEQSITNFNKRGRYSPHYQVWCKCCMAGLDVHKKRL
jgi:hypothetical protein